MIANRTRKTTIQEGSKAYNDQRRAAPGGLDETAGITEIVYLANPEQVHCTICGCVGDPRHKHDAGWWKVGAYPVCAACVADSHSKPDELKRRVRRVRRKYAGKCKI